MKRRENGIDMNWNDELKRYQADALSIAVIRHGQIADTVAEGDGVSIHTRFQAASVSKMVFTVAVLCLAGEGRLSLDGDVSRYLGGLRLRRKDGLPVKATVRQVLSHTAGFGVGGFEGYKHGAALPTTAQIILGEPPCNSPEVMQEYTPGEHWIYSGGGFMVLQKCVENISGLPFAGFMEQTVLRPLDMTDSTYRQDVAGDLAKGYTTDFTPVPNGHNLMPEQAAAGLWTTAVDLAKFGMHLQGILRGDEGLVPQALVREMITPQHSDVLDVEDTDCKTGLGCYLKTIRGEAYFGHSGDNVGFKSLVNFSVQSGTGCCVLVNSDTAAPLPGKIQDFFLGRG